MNGNLESYDQQALNESPAEHPPSMVGPILGLATTLCLVAASWINDLEQVMKIIASFLGCVTSIVTIRAIHNRSKRSGNGIL